MDTNRPVTLTETTATSISHLKVAKRQNKLETITFFIIKLNSDFALVSKSLDVEPSKILMESLRSNFNDLVKQTLVMESVLDLRLQSQTTKRHQGIR